MGTLLAQKRIKPICQELLSGFWEALTHPSPLRSLIEIPLMENNASPLGIQLFIPPHSTPYHPAPMGFLSLVALIRSTGNTYPLPQRTLTHKGSSFSWAARADNVSFAQAWVRQTSTHCVPQNWTNLRVSCPSHCLCLGAGHQTRRDIRRNS